MLFQAIAIVYFHAEVIKGEWKARDIKSEEGEQEQDERWERRPTGVLTTSLGGRARGIEVS